MPLEISKIKPNNIPRESNSAASSKANSTNGVSASSAGFCLSTLQHVLSCCVYGGRMEDELDMATLKTFLETICSKEMLETDWDLDPEGIYHNK